MADVVTTGEARDALHQIARRFLTRDPLVALTQSPYGYAAGSPLNAADPSGLDCGWGDPLGCASDAGQWAWNHPKEVGIGLGLVALAATGVGGLAAAGIVGLTAGEAATAGVVALAAGAGATYLDYKPCVQGDKMACGGMIMGAGGLIYGGGAFVIGTFLSIEESQMVITALSVQSMLIGGGGVALDGISLGQSLSKGSGC